MYKSVEVHSDNLEGNRNHFALKASEKHENSVGRNHKSTNTWESDQKRKNVLLFDLQLIEIGIPAL